MTRATKTLDIMLDLETLGKSTRAVIAQLSAVPFFIDEGPIKGESFNEYISPQSCVAVGLNCSGEDESGTTMDFWLRQDKDVFNKVIVKALLDGRDLATVLQEFTAWVQTMMKKYDCKTVKIWGNGPSADCVWVRSAYEACHLKAPWKYWDDACVRTVVDLGNRSVGATYKRTNKFIGEKHNAIDDCIFQIQYVCDTYRDMIANKKTTDALQAEIEVLKSQLALSSKKRVRSVKGTVKDTKKKIA